METTEVTDDCGWCGDAQPLSKIGKSRSRVRDLTLLCRRAGPVGDPIAAPIAPPGEAIGPAERDYRHGQTRGRIELLLDGGYAQA